MLYEHIKETARRRPALAIKLGIMIAIFVICFIYVEFMTPSDNKVNEFLSLLGGAMVAVGIDAFIIYFEKYHYVCKDD